MPLTFGPLTLGHLDLRTRTLVPSGLRTFAPFLICFCCLILPLALFGQEAGDAQRITDRIRSLQREAERLAKESRSLVGDLRQREIDRDIKVEQLKQAEAVMNEAEKALQSTTTRLSDLEVQRINQLPDLRTQLVDVYKRGRSGYARMLFSAGDFRQFARATRAIGALSALNQRRIQEHQKTLAAMREERTAFQQTAKELQAKTVEARKSKSAADAALASVTELIRQIDSRRDLTAQYVGELQVAYTRLQQQVTTLATEKPAGEPVAVPLRPFQGALEWPVQGRLVGPFGQPSSRLGGTAVRNGIEIAAEEDSPVRAIHGGSVGYAGPFTGFGTLVILDHGLREVSVPGAETISRGQEASESDRGQGDQVPTESR